MTTLTRDPWIDELKTSDVFELARKFYEPYILRGDTIGQISTSSMGMATPRGYRITTGGYLNGLSLRSRQVGVALCDGRTFVFKLEDMFTATRDGSQLSLF